MNYDELSDFEINKLVAEKSGVLIPVPDGLESEQIGDVLCYYDENRVIWACHEDYCDSWDNAGPIIEENNIELSPLFRGDWCASHINKYTYDEAPVYDLQATNENPRRAAMIVYLKMGD